MNSPHEQKAKDRPAVERLTKALESSPHRLQQGFTEDDFAAQLNNIKTPPRSNDNQMGSRIPRRKKGTSRGTAYRRPTNRNASSIIVPGSSLGATRTAATTRVPSIHHKYQDRKQRRLLEGGGQGPSRNRYRNSNNLSGRSNTKNRNHGAGSNDYLDQAMRNQGQVSSSNFSHYKYASTKSKRSMKSSQSGGRFSSPNSKSKVCSMSDDDLCRENFYNQSPPSSQERRYSRKHHYHDLDEDDGDFDPSANPDTDTEEVDLGIKVEPDDKKQPITIDESDSDESHFSDAKNRPQQQQLVVEEEEQTESFRNENGKTKSTSKLYIGMSHNIKTSLSFSKQNNMREDKKTKKGM